MSESPTLGESKDPLRWWLAPADQMLELNLDPLLVQFMARHPVQINAFVSQEAHGFITTIMNGGLPLIQSILTRYPASGQTIAETTNTKSIPRFYKRIL